MIFVWQCQYFYKTLYKNTQVYDKKFYFFIVKSANYTDSFVLALMAVSPKKIQTGKRCTN